MSAGITLERTYEERALELARAEVEALEKIAKWVEKINYRLATIVVLMAGEEDED